MNADLQGIVRDGAETLNARALPVIGDERFIAALIFLAVAAVVFLILVLARRISGVNPELDARLSALGGKARGTDRLSIIRGDIEASELGTVSVNRWLHDLSLMNRIQRYIAQAGSALGVGEFLAFIVLTALVVGAAAWFGGWPDPRAIVAGVLGGLIPIFWIMRRRARRMQLFSSQIPDALDLMAGSLRAGHAYSAAVQVVADELPEPISDEFRTMAEEYRVGLNHRECLERLLLRVDHPDLHLFAVSVLIQTETGGNLAEVLDGLANTVRGRFKMEGKVRALTAEGRMSGAVLAALPIIMGVVLHLLNPGYLTPLIKEPIGHYAIGAAVTLQILGFFWIRKIVRIAQ